MFLLHLVTLSLYNVAHSVRPRHNRVLLLLSSKQILFTLSCRPVLPLRSDSLCYCHKLLKFGTCQMVSM